MRCALRELTGFRYDAEDTKRAKIEPMVEPSIEVEPEVKPSIEEEENGEVGHKLIETAIKYLKEEEDE